MNPLQLISFYENQQPQILKTIGELVEEETPTDEKGRLDVFAARLADRYAAAGLETEIVDNQVRGNHIRARFEPAAHVDKPDAAPALILAIMTRSGQSVRWNRIRFGWMNRDGPMVRAFSICSLVWPWWSMFFEVCRA